MSTHITPEMLTKVAEVNQAIARDEQNAFELGVMKYAQDLGLDEAQYRKFRAVGDELLAAQK